MIASFFAEPADNRAPVRYFAVAIQMRQARAQSEQRIASRSLQVRAIVGCNLHHTTPGGVKRRICVHELVVDATNILARATCRFQADSRRRAGSFARFFDGRPGTWLALVAPQSRRPPPLSAEETSCPTPERCSGRIGVREVPLSDEVANLSLAKNCPQGSSDWPSMALLCRSARLGVTPRR
jgi:hypothetical protein